MEFSEKPTVRTRVKQALTPRMARNRLNLTTHHDWAVGAEEGVLDYGIDAADH